MAWMNFIQAQDGDEVFVTLYAGDGGQTPPDTTPLVITPVFCCRIGHRRTEPGGYFC